MDILCSVCMEPWDIDSLHDEAEVLYEEMNFASYGECFDSIMQSFKKDGCKALGAGHSDNDSHPVVSAIYDLMGDDIDGAASAFEDMEQYL